MSEPAAPDPLAAALDNPTPAPLFADAGDPGPELRDGHDEEPPFPPGSPVQCLGISADISGSQKCYYLDINGQLVGLEAGNRHGKNSMIALFGGRTKWLEANFPQWSAPQYEGRGAARTLVKDSEIVGFDQAESSRALIVECARKGIFDAAGKIRGRGAHPHGNGGLVIHYGNKLLVSQHRLDGEVKSFTWRDVGLFEGFVYCAAAPTPRPWHERVGPKPAETLLALLRTWRWRRPLLDARFLLGWIGAAMIGGALDWRPNVWITGGAGTGKSTINGRNKLLHLLFGEALFRTGNASAAAIRGSLRNATVPVMFDELEASVDTRQADAVVQLARVSSSGENMHRGSADQTVHEFTLASCFQFSSINIPKLEPQDRSRLGILELDPFPVGAVAPVLEEYNLPELGQKLQRRMIDGWHRFAVTKGRFHAALAKGGHSARACDQFGTLLACADILINELPADDEEVAEWAGECRPERMAEISEATPDHEECLWHLLTRQVQAKGNDEREALGTWIGRAVGSALTPLFEGDDLVARDKASDRLQQIGLKLVNAKWLPEEKNLEGELVKPGRWGSAEYHAMQPGYLAVANSHQGLAGIYQGTKWQGGVWRQSLGRWPGALACELKFGRIKARAVLLPLAAVLDESELPAASKPAAAADWVAAQIKGAGA